VITNALPTTSSIADLYATADPVAIATLLANKAVERSMQARLEEAWVAVTNKLVDILGTYKATMTATGTGPSPQLVISENMKILPLLLLGFLKLVSTFLKKRMWLTQSCQIVIAGLTSDQVMQSIHNELSIDLNRLGPDQDTSCSHRVLEDQT